MNAFAPHHAPQHLRGPRGPYKTRRPHHRIYPAPAAMHTGLWIVSFFLTPKFIANLLECWSFFLQFSFFSRICSNIPQISGSPRTTADEVIFDLLWSDPTQGSGCRPHAILALMETYRFCSVETLSFMILRAWGLGTSPQIGHLAAASEVSFVPSTLLCLGGGLAFNRICWTMDPCGQAAARAFQRPRRFPCYSSQGNGVLGKRPMMVAWVLHVMVGLAAMAAPAWSVGSLRPPRASVGSVETGQLILVPPPPVEGAAGPPPLCQPLLSTSHFANCLTFSPPR